MSPYKLECATSPYPKLSKPPRLPEPARRLPNRRRRLAVSRTSASTFRLENRVLRFPSPVVRLAIKFERRQHRTRSGSPRVRPQRQPELSQIRTSRKIDSRRKHN